MALTAKRLYNVDKEVGRLWRLLASVLLISAKRLRHA